MCSGRWGAVLGWDIRAEEQEPRKEGNQEQKKKVLNDSEE
jgi:hypothetical protein